VQRGERISTARWFVWRGLKLEARPELGFALLDALRRHHEGEIECPVALDNEVMMLTQTQTEDLLDLLRDSQLALAKARANQP
jgi:hypothetical protein